MRTVSSCELRVASFERTVRCDVCSALRGESRRWFYVSTAIEGRDNLLIGLFDELASMVEDDIGSHCCATACGEKCLHILLSRWLETRTFDAPPTRSEAVVSTQSSVVGQGEA